MCALLILIIDCSHFQEKKEGLGMRTDSTTLGVVYIITIFIPHKYVLCMQVKHENLGNRQKIENGK